MTERRKAISDHGQAVTVPAPKVGLRLVNGRVVGRSIADPDVKKEVKKLHAALRQNTEGLTKFYVDQGILTPAGKLSKRFGGA